MSPFNSFSTETSSSFLACQKSLRVLEGFGYQGTVKSGEGCSEVAGNAYTSITKFGIQLSIPTPLRTESYA